MRVMTILGSLRRQGKTAKVLGWIEEPLRTAGHHIDMCPLDVVVETMLQGLQP
jgi:NAD(P)H-dependent FMN reductase